MGYLTQFLALALPEQQTEFVGNLSVALNVSNQEAEQRFYQEWANATEAFDPNVSMCNRCARGV